MTRMEKICTICTTIFALVFACSAQAEELTVRHVVGGKADSLEINGSYWYQSLGDKLVVLKKNSGEQVATILLTSYEGESFCKDILITNNTLYALLDSGVVVTCTLADPALPKVLSRAPVQGLGSQASELVQVGAWPIALGRGGAIRLTDGNPIVGETTNITGVALSTESGVAYCLDGQIIDLNTKEILGQADVLVALEDSANADFGSSIAIQLHYGSTVVSLLTPAMTPFGTQESSVVIEGNYQNILSRGSRLLVTTDVGVYVIGIAPDELRVLRKFDIKGVRDADIIASNYLALCGEFGRAIYRIESDKGGDGNQLMRVVSATGTFAPGVSDIRGVHVPNGDTSLWYEFDETVTFFDTPATVIDAQTSAVVLGLEANVNPETGVCTTTGSSRSDESVITSFGARTVVSIQGRIWVGTKHGVIVFRGSAEGSNVEVASIQLAGPIVQLIPLFDGSAAFVSEAGMVGIIELTQPVVALEQ
jgi:hypothetical protein